MLHDTHDLIHVQMNEEIKLTAFNLQHFNISFLIVIQNRLKRIFNDISHTNANFGILITRTDHLKNQCLLI